MEQILKTLLEMDPNMISNYVNYFFIAIAAIGLIGFLIGFIKGMYKELTTLIITLLYLLFVIFANKILTNAIYEVDITQFVAVPDGVVTIGDYLNNLFIEICETNGIIIGTSEELLHSIISISLAFINLVVYIVLFLAGIVIITIFDFLIYFLVVRLIVPKETRKHKKRRVVGGISGFLRYVVIFSLFLTPFTALVNTTVGKLRDEDGTIQRKELDNDFYNALMNVLEGYNNSAVAKMFFIIDDDEGRSLDVMFMDFVSKSYIDEEKAISLYSEIGNFGSLAVSALSTGFIESTSSINTSLLLSADFVGDAISTIAKSTLIQTLLSVGATLAVNINEVKETVDLSSIDFMNMDWESSLTAVSSAYKELYDCGLITEVIESPESFMNEFYLDGKYSSGIKQALRNIGDNDLICQIMPCIISSFINTMEKDGGLLQAKRSSNQDVFDTLSDPNTYKNIKWGSELATIYEIFENISKQYYAFENEHLTISSINSLQTDSLLNALFGTGVDFKLSTDTSYSQQYDRNVFVNGGIYINDGITHEIPGIKNIFGVGDNQNMGLLNSQIITTMFEKKVFNEFISLLDVNSMVGIDSSEVDLNEKIVNVISGWDKSNWQDEFEAIIDVVCPIMNLVSIISDNGTLSGAKRASLGEMDLETILGDDSLDCLKRVTDVLQVSKIFDDILPDILESVTDKETEDIIPGLAIADLNFTYFPNQNNSMVKELRKFINDVDSINENLIDLLNDLDGDDVINTLVNDCSKKQDSVFGSLLKIIERNQIFNKPLTEEEIKNNEHKTFTNLMMNFLCKGHGSSDLNLYSLTDGKVVIEDKTIENFEKSSTGWEKEIEGLVGFIGSLKGQTSEDQVILDYLSGNLSDDFDLGTEIFSCGNEIERIFSSVDKSDILKEAFPDTFEMLIGDSFSEVIGGSPNFHNIVSWAAEGHYFNQLLTNIDSLRENGQNLTEIDWLSVEETKLVNILTSLYDTQSVGGTYYNQDREYGVFHSMLKNIISQALESLEIKIEGDDVPEEDIISRDFDIDNTEKVIYKEVGNTKVYVSWLGDESNGYDGEIKNVARMVKYVSNITGEETIDELEDVLLSVNDCYVLRNTLGLIIESKTEEYKNDEDELMREFISRSDFEVFHKEQLSLTPYDLVNDEVVEKDPSTFVINRESEVEVREVELKNIVAILNDADEISSSIIQDSENGFEEVNKILENATNTGDSTKPDESRLEKILVKMHNSEIFNTKLYDDENNRVLTAFEYFFEYVLKDDAFIVDGARLLLIPTLEEIVTISSDNSLLEDGWVNGEGIIGEITNFNNSLYNAINNPLVEVKLHHLDFIETVKGTMAQKDSDGVSIEVNGELLRDNSKTPIQDLLNDLYGSRLLKKSNGHILDKHIVNYLLKSIGYGEEQTNLDHEVNRNIYEDFVLQLDEQELKNRLISVGVHESNIDEDINVSLWENEGKSVEDLIFAIDSDLSNFNINKFDSEFIGNLIEPLENSVGLNYLTIESQDYKNNIRSIYHLVVIKLINTTIDAFDDTLGLYTDNVNDNLISSYQNEVEVSKDLIDAYKEMDQENKFASGNITFTDDSEENKEFMDLIVKVLEPLYRSSVYHNIDILMNGENRISKINGEDKELSNLTLFEQVVYTMLNSSEHLTKELYYDDQGIEYPEEISSGEEVINLRIREVSKMDTDPTSNLKWIIMGSDNKIAYDCEIGKVHDMAGENLDNILDPNNLDLTTIVKDITNPEEKDKLLNIINGSYILHDIVPHVIARYVSTHGAEDSPSENTIAVDDLIFLKKTELNGQYDYSSTRGYAGEHIDSYIVEHTYSDFYTRVEHWNNDLHYVSQLTLLLDEIEQNRNIEFNLSGEVKLSNVFGRLLYNLSKTETYKNAVPQIVISVLNDKLHVNISSSIELSMGNFIDGDNNPQKLVTMYSLIDNLYGITEQLTTYSAEIWEEEGKGIDMYIKYVQTRNVEDTPTTSYALGYHMYNNFISILSTL